MKANETNFFKFLEGNKQFVVPIYQRTYSWTREQCEQLWHDIIHAATHEEVKGHFVGSIVYIQQGLYQATGISQMLLIDGQQRLTTLTLLLVALIEAINRGEKPATIKTTKITNSYLTNPDEDGDERFKLILTQQDKPTLVALIDHRDLPVVPAPRLYENYLYFLDQIRKSPLDPQELYNGIGKVILVDIALDREHDNPQLIFESLNSTGMDLSQADLIRNNVLMRLEPRQQNRLYMQHWYPMEQLFGPERYLTYFDGFTRNYLTIKMHAIPRQDAIYKAFKRYREDIEHEMPIDAIVEDMHHFAKLFAWLAFNQERDAEIRDAISDLNEVEVIVVYPFLLEVYDDYEHQRVPKADFIAIIRLVESYVFRRAICEIPSYSMNKTFAMLMRSVEKSDYLASVERAFMVMTSYQRFPRDDEFRRKLETKDVYHFKRNEYLLRKPENTGRKEHVILQGLTIEHIIPQVRSFFDLAHGSWPGMERDSGTLSAHHRQPYADRL